MSEQNPPFVMGNSTSNTTEEFRDTLSSITSGAGGVIVLETDLVVAALGTPNMSVNVSGGRCLIPGTESALQGSYHCTSSGTVNLVVAAADPSSTRHDIVVAKVQDSQYSGGTDAWSLAVVTGTPGSGDPSLPNNCIKLARLTIPALAGSVTGGMITDLRVRANPQRAGLIVEADGLGGTGWNNVEGQLALVTVQDPGFDCYIVAKCQVTIDASVAGDIWTVRIRQDSQTGAVLKATRQNGLYQTHVIVGATVTMTTGTGFPKSFSLTLQRQSGSGVGITYADPTINFIQAQVFPLP